MVRKPYMDSLWQRFCHFDEALGEQLLKFLGLNIAPLKFGWRDQQQVDEGLESGVPAFT